MDYFDTLVMYLIIQAHIETIYKFKKIFISEQVYVINIDPVVMTLPFGAYMISATRYAIRTSPIDWSPHQHFGLIRRQHLAQAV